MQRGARLAQSVEHETLNLRVVGSSPTLGGAPFIFWLTNVLVPFLRKFLQNLRMFKPEMPLVQELNRVDELVMTEPKRASYIFFVNVPTASAQQGARLAQSVEHETLNLRVVGSSPTLGGTFFLLAS